MYWIEYLPEFGDSESDKQRPPRFNAGGGVRARWGQEHGHGDCHGDCGSAQVTARACAAMCMYSIRSYRRLCVGYEELVRTRQAFRKCPECVEIEVMHTMLFLARRFRRSCRSPSYSLHVPDPFFCFFSSRSLSLFCSSCTSFPCSVCFVSALVAVLSHRELVELLGGVGLSTALSDSTAEILGFLTRVS